MELDTFTVGLQPRRPDDFTRPNGETTRWLNVVDIDASAKTVTVKYGGAYTGAYRIIIESSRNGLIRSRVRFDSLFEITDFNPKVGSRYGGQLVTIEGGHFSDNPLENPIKIGYEYTSGVIHYCDIVTTSDS